MKEIIFQLFTAAGLLFWSGLAIAAPRAVPVNSGYEFPPTPDGQELMHEFIIQNQGDSELKILSVMPSCSCVSHSFDRIIPPGGEGAVKIGVRTSGYGGKQFNRSVLVKTNDPDNRKIYFTVTGKVTRTVTITPAMVSMRGNPGQHLEAWVTISPAENFKMNILEMTRKFNTRIQAELMAPDHGSRDWHVKIKIYSDKVENLYEMFRFKTDNLLKPELTVRVYVSYRAAAGDGN